MRVCAFMKNIFDELYSVTYTEIRKEADTQAHIHSTHVPIHTKVSILLSATKCQRIQYQATTAHQTFFI